MATAVLFSPSLRGHRQTYCRVLAQILLDAGLDVTVVAGVQPAPDVAPLGAPQLRGLEGRDGYSFVALPEEGAALLQRDPAGFGRLLDGLGTEAVFLAEADAARQVITRRALRRGRPRRWVGLFIRSTNYVYETHRAEGLAGRVAGARRTARRVRRWHSDAQLFHEVLLPRLGLLDGVLCLDEAYAKAHGGHATWLPDIYTSGPWRAGEDADEARRWSGELRDFMAGQGERPVFTYVGAPQARRGYAELARLALAEGGCLLHCGRTGTDVSDDAAAAREELRRRGALFETDAYYDNDATADVFLRQAVVVVLPYRHHLGSSGVMLQALAAGRPVLVPDQGLMGHRVRVFGLGRTYAPGDEADLRRAYRALAADGAAPYRDAIDRFMSAFSRAQTEVAVKYAMGRVTTPARPPVPWPASARGVAR